MREISPENQLELEKRYRATAFLVLGQILFSVILMPVVWLIAPDSAVQNNPKIVMPLWIAALLIAVGTFIGRRMLLRWENLRDVATSKGIVGVYANLQKSAIFLSAAAELIVIIGVVIVFLSGQRDEIFRAGIIALVVFVINFPRKSVWNKIALSLGNV